MEQINHLVLCAASDNTSDPDEQNEQVYTSDDDTRVYAPTQTTNENVYIPKRKSMHIRVYLHTCKKREEERALLDSGATENFMHLSYARRLKYPVHELNEPRLLYNVNRTINKAGKIHWYMDIKVQTRTQHTWMRFFLSDLGNNRIILGYPWFSAVQPNIDWQ